MTAPVFDGSKPRSYRRPSGQQYCPLPVRIFRQGSCTGNVNSPVQSQTPGARPLLCCTPASILSEILSITPASWCNGVLVRGRGGGVRKALSVRGEGYWALQVPPTFVTGISREHTKIPSEGKSDRMRISGFRGRGIIHQFFSSVRDNVSVGHRSWEPFYSVCDDGRGKYMYIYIGGKENNGKSRTSTD